MTILIASRHAWASTFCHGCKRLVNYQAEDVGTFKGMREWEYRIECKCGTKITIARIDSTQARE